MADQELGAGWYVCDPIKGLSSTGYPNAEQAIKNGYNYKNIRYFPHEPKVSNFDDFEYMLMLFPGSVISALRRFSIA